MRTHELATIANVKERTLGGTLSASVSASATSLTLDDVGDFSEEGGLLTLEGETYSYTAVDEDANTVAISPGLVTDADENDVVRIVDPDGREATERYALCRIDDARGRGDLVTARIAHALQALVVLGARSKREWCRLTFDGQNWVVTDFLGHTPEADETIIVPGTGGGGITAAFPLDEAPATPHSKDDEFDGPSLDAKWTNPLTSAAGQTNSISFVNGAIRIEPATSGIASTGKRVFGIRQAAPTGSFSVMAKILESGVGNDIRSGVFVGTAGGKGHIAGPFRQDGVPAYIGVTTISDTADWSAYDGSQSLAVGGAWYIPTWVRIRWDASASTIYWDYSQNGVIWTEASSRTGMSQPDRVGLCIYSNSATVLAHEWMAAEWFRITEP